MDALLVRHVNTLASSIELETMVTTDEVVSPEESFRERHQAMRATVFQRSQTAVR